MSKNDLSPDAKRVLEVMIKSADRWPKGFKVTYSPSRTDSIQGAKTLVEKGLATKEEGCCFQLTDKGRQVGGGRLKKTLKLSWGRPIRSS